MRSWLYVPANSPKKLLQAGIYGADAIVFDLEDAVAPSSKREARLLLLELIDLCDFGSATLSVRINGVGTPWWREDLRTLAPVLGPGKLEIIRIPKTESPAMAASVASELNGLERREGLTEGSLKLHCLIETPLGTEYAFSIAASSPRILALVFGAEDYCSIIGISRYGPAYALDYPRSRIVAAAASCGMEAYDSVWGAFRDTEGLKRDALRGKALGFSGKSVIHPDQVPIVNALFSPSEEEILWAEHVVSEAAAARSASKEETESGSGVFSVVGMMADAPVIARAERILARRGGIRSKEQEERNRYEES